MASSSGEMAATSNAGKPFTPPGRWFFTKEQLLNTISVKAGLSVEKEMSYRQQAANFIQEMGQHLRVTQLCINTAIVYTYRFYMFHPYQRFHRNSIASAALFLAAKVEEQPRKLEHVIKMAHICLHRDAPPLDPRSESYHEKAQELITNENLLLQTLGFDVAIDHPHTHVVRCCQLVKASKELAQASYYLATNSLHLTTMCLRYSPTVVACFCIHLACKWSNYKIPLSAQNREWYTYVDPSVTDKLLEDLTDEFLTIYDQCPSRLKKKIKASTQAASTDGSLNPNAELGIEHTSIKSASHERHHQRSGGQPVSAGKHHDPSRPTTLQNSHAGHVNHGNGHGSHKPDPKTRPHEVAKAHTSVDKTHKPHHHHHNQHQEQHAHRANHIHSQQKQGLPPAPLTNFLQPTSILTTPVQNLAPSSLTSQGFLPTHHTEVTEKNRPPASSRSTVGRSQSTVPKSQSPPTLSSRPTSRSIFDIDSPVRSKSAVSKMDNVPEPPKSDLPIPPSTAEPKMSKLSSSLFSPSPTDNESKADLAESTVVAVKKPSPNVTVSKVSMPIVSPANTSVVRAQDSNVVEGSRRQVSTEPQLPVVPDPKPELPSEEHKKHKKEKKKKKSKDKEKDRDREKAKEKEVNGESSSIKKHKHKHKEKEKIKHRDADLDRSEPPKPIKLKIKAPVPPAQTPAVAPLKILLPGRTENDPTRKRPRTDFDCPSGPASKMSRVLGTSVDAETKFLNVAHSGANSQSGRKVSSR